MQRILSLVAIAFICTLNAGAADQPLPPSVKATMDRLDKSLTASRQQAIADLDRTAKDEQRKGNKDNVAAIEAMATKLKADVAAATEAAKPSSKDPGKDTTGKFGAVADKGASDKDGADAKEVKDSKAAIVHAGDAMPLWARPYAVDGIIETEVADLIQPAGAEPRIGLVTAGAAPRAQLAFKLALGTKQNVHLTRMESRWAIRHGVRELTDPDPREIYDLAIEIVGKDHGTAQIKAMITAADDDAPEPSRQQSAQMYKDEIRGVKGADLTFSLTPTGACDDIEYTGVSERGDAPVMRLQRFIIPYLLPPLPKEPIGIGAVWVCVERMPEGFHSRSFDAIRFTTYTLKDHVGSKLRISVDACEYAATHASHWFMQPGSYTHILESHDHRSTDLVVDLEQIWPTALLTHIDSGGRQQLVHPDHTQEPFVDDEALDVTLGDPDALDDPLSPAGGSDHPMVTVYGAIAPGDIDPAAATWFTVNHPKFFQTLFVRMVAVPPSAIAAESKLVPGGIYHALYTFDTKKNDKGTWGVTAYKVKRIEANDGTADHPATVLLDLGKPETYLTSDVSTTALVVYGIDLHSRTCGPGGPHVRQREYEIAYSRVCDDLIHFPTPADAQAFRWTASGLRARGTIDGNWLTLGTAHIVALDQARIVDLDWWDGAFVQLKDTATGVYRYIRQDRIQHPNRETFDPIVMDGELILGGTCSPGNGNQTNCSYVLKAGDPPCTGTFYLPSALSAAELPRSIRHAAQLSEAAANKPAQQPVP